MIPLKGALNVAAERNPDRIALQDGQTKLTYRELEQSVDELSIRLQSLNPRALGLLADNGLGWALVDLAAICTNIPLVPLPLFFSPQQLLHVIRDAGLDAVLTDHPEQVLSLLHSAGIRCQSEEQLAGLDMIRILDVSDKILPPGAIKITYTSGTTSDPKGVCLRRSQIEAVATSLREACLATDQDRHLCLTPLSTLLENIGGIYVPLLAGAGICLPPLHVVGLRGATELNVAQMIEAINRFDATSIILAPQMLHAMVIALKCGATRPKHLRFVAVGGAPVSQQLLLQAEKLGIPVYEGYGMSECASVIALNTPSEHHPGSVGRPLPHVGLSFAEDGEILLDNPGFLGYLGQGAPQRPWPTGDLGYLDEDGFLHLTGRKKSMFITSFGRNVAPEWVERELSLHLVVAQAAVFGEGRPYNIAVIVARPGFSEKEVESAVHLTNRSLPDYAQITTWILASEPFSMKNGQLTANGRLKREAIQNAYTKAIEELYLEEIYGVL